MTKIAASFIIESQEFQQLQAADARNAARKHGHEIEVAFAEGNAVTQIRQIFKWIQLPEAERPAAILVEPISDDGFERVARSAVASGIGWVLINAYHDYLNELRAERPDLPITSVRADHREIGKIQGQQFRKLLPHGGQVLYIQGPARSTAAKKRLLGMQATIEGSNIDLHIIKGDWTEASGERAAEQWLRMRSNVVDPPRVVGCQNDAMAIGAKRAFDAHGWTKLAYTGCDGLPSGGQKWVKTGELTATVVTPSNAGPAIDLLTAHIRGQRQLPATTKLAPRSLPSATMLSSLQPLRADEMCS